MIAAWFCATGAGLDLVQTYAWARMFEGFARETTLGEAAAETFDSSHMCPICRAVQREKEAAARQRSQASPSEERITVLALQASDCGLFPPRARAWPSLIPARASARGRSVPVPPPRGCLLEA